MRELESNFRLFSLFTNKNDEITIRVEIGREKGNKKITLLNTPTEKKISNHRKYLLKREISLDKKFAEKLKEEQTKNPSKWYLYEWIKIVEENVNKIIYAIDNKEYHISYEKIKINTEENKNKVISLISSIQRFLYIPAYRGGKNERTNAIEKLFDIIIDDLVTSKGVTTDFDRITDAIWGTGKNSNPYNLYAVVEERINALIDNIKNESISSIKGISFKPYERKEIRRQILKVMLGSTNIVLDDGIVTSYESKGTGIQSSFMISLLKSLSQIEFTNSLNIILVIEEPEAFTHPQLTREIIDKMVNNKVEGFQYIITTHSPVIVDYIDASKIQRFSESNNSSIKQTVNLTNSNNSLTIEDWNLINRIIDLNLSEIIFSDFVIFVEGEGDKYVINQLLKIALGKNYHRISIVAINGNGQIFKLKKLLDYFMISWILVTDKDSFIDRKNDEEEIQSHNLNGFFEKYQIGLEFQDFYKKVLENPNVEKIVISSIPSENVNQGTLLRKLKDIDNNVNIDDIEGVFSIATKNINDDFIPDAIALQIADELNKKLQKLAIPFYSLPGDLESTIVNDSTFNFAQSVFKKYYPDSFKSFEQRTAHYDNQAKINELRKVLGSKRFEIKKIPNSAKERKKPHIPLEIISEYIQNLRENNLLTTEKVLSDFKEINYLVEIINSELEMAW